MNAEAKPVLTGGCQCGAIRFAVKAAPVKISICHCRMCQKATGAPFASFADIERTDFSWTKGKPAAFRSSSIAERDFCASCGTPLSFRRIDGSRIEIMTGTFDRPDRVIPTRQNGTESRTCRVKPRCRIMGRRRWPPSPATSIRIMTSGVSATY
jgi:hypothetical protein